MSAFLFSFQKDYPGKFSDMSWTFQEHFPDISRTLLGNLSEMASKFPWFVYHNIHGFLPEDSWKISGCFMEICRKCPGHFQEISGKFPGHFLEISCFFLGNALVITIPKLIQIWPMMASIRQILLWGCSKILFESVLLFLASETRIWRFVT